MSNYKDYPCWDCSYYNNCGKEYVKLSYKFNRSGECESYKKSLLYADEIVIEKRQKDFINHIEYLLDNRIPRNMW